MTPDCTLTTCCFNLTKYNVHARDMMTTINNMKSLLEIPCYLVIYTDEITFPYIKNIRDSFDLDILTKYIVMNVENLESFTYLEMVKNNRKLYHPTKDDRTCPESHLVCCAKFDLVLQTMTCNPFNTSHFGWIDSNIGVNFQKICTNYKNNMLLNILNNCNEEKFYLQILNVCDKNYIDDNNLKEYYNQYRWVVCGSLFITGKNIGKIILTELKNIFIKHTTLGYGHAEEMFYLEILDKYYDNIKRSYGDYKHILNNFIDVSVGMDYIKYIANRYMTMSYHKECIECCDAVLTQYEKYNIEINYDFYFDFLFYKYVSLYYYNNRDARKFVLHIIQLIETNPYIKKVYNKNKEFYDSQFRFAL